MKISEWALTNIARTMFTQAELMGIGKVTVDATGDEDGIHISGKDADGRHISIELDADEVRRVSDFATRVKS